MVTGNLVKRLVPKARQNVGIEPGAFRFQSQRPNPLGYSIFIARLTGVRKDLHYPRTINLLLSLKNLKIANLKIVSQLPNGNENIFF